MRIDDRNAIAGSTAARTADVAQTYAASGKGFGASARLGGDSVELSGPSVAIRSHSAAHGAKLERLAKAVQNSSYAVDPSLISQALVGEALASGQGS